MRLMALASSSTSSRRSVANSVCATTLRVRCIMSMAMSRCSPGSPLVAHADCLADHRAGVFRNALAMKGGLRNLALGAMLSAFAGDHALAQQHLRALDRAFLDEVFVLHDEHFANVVGVIQKDDVIPSDFVVRDVAVFPSQVLKQQDGIRRPKSAKANQKRFRWKPGGKRYSKGLRTSFRGASFRAAVAILIVYVDWTDCWATRPRWILAGVSRSYKIQSAL